MNAQKALTLSEIPLLEKELILAHILHKSRSWITAHPEHELSSDEEEHYRSLLTRREKHEPVAYLIQEREFYGRSFFVDERVLIPRPATEGLIDLTLNLLQTGEETIQEVDTQIIVGAHLFRAWEKPQAIVDVGTGSGCIAITLALERPDLRVIATDKSDAALSVAEVNSAKHGVSDRVSLLKGNLLDPLPKNTEPFLVVSNPPYVPVEETLMPDVERYEPHAALFGGKDGMEILTELWKQAEKHPSCIGIVLECREEQWLQLK